MRVTDLTSHISYASLSAAISGSAANDVIAITAGSYVENFPAITHSLTIESVGGLAHLTTPQPIPRNLRAILAVPANLNVSLTVSGLELSGAVDPIANSNGAGILFEAGNANLTVRNSWFHDNQEGILVGGATAASTAGMTVTIDHSEFGNNGIALGQPGSGFTHNLYVNAVTRLTVTNSYFHDAIGGHEIKSRARTSIIANNRIQDQAGSASYSIDLADGGAAIVAGNLIEKGVNAPNRYAVHFAGEGTYANSALTVRDNTFIGDRPHGTTAVFNQSKDSAGRNIPATITGNTLYAIPIAHLYQDGFGPPYDHASSTVASSAAAPPLDTSHPFAVAGPPGGWILLPALLATAVLRRVQARRRRRKYAVQTPTTHV